jgi:DtxR family Mn-dependent transcriptional regulator
VPTTSIEDYLKCILLEEEHFDEKRVPTGRIAHALGVAPGSATAMVKALSERGLVAYRPYAGTALTDDGRRLAVAVLRRHRLVELFLVRILGMDWSEVHAEAERLEHHISDPLLERIDDVLGRPEFDPHGDPIPTIDGEVAPMTLAPLTRHPVGAAATIARVLDQTPSFLRRLSSLGLDLGARVVVRGRDVDTATLALDVEGEGLRSAHLGLEAAAKILVRRAS